MVIRKVMKLNKDGTLGIVIPAKAVKELNINPESYVNVEVVGRSLHVTQIKVE